MRLLYYCKINFAEQGNSGIVKKIFSQAKALRKAGFACDLFYFENNACVLEKAEVHNAGTSTNLGNVSVFNILAT
jgi:hypothetical protein